MRLFHLSYDNGKMDAADVAKVLRDKLNVTEIGRPVESTMVFKMTPSLDDVDRITKALKQKFTADDACFVVSRVVSLEHGEDDVRDHIRVKPGKDHVEGFDKVIEELNKEEEAKIHIKNLKSF